jgi:hypothetical protein
MRHTLKSFPSVTLPSISGGLPVEVVLIAQLGPGAGNHLIGQACALQQGHEAFVDELDEPSARIGGLHLDQGDASSLYSFAVGKHGHPFHRHAGQRMFTAISGSDGAQLRFSTASSGQMAHDPENFLRALHRVDIPPDSLFTVRFGGETWHQFVPGHSGSHHPVLFALSCHPNELGGSLTAEQESAVRGNQADIPTLTEVLPDEVLALLAAPGRLETTPRTTLTVNTAPSSWLHGFCGISRRIVGRLHMLLPRAPGKGFRVHQGEGL